MEIDLAGNNIADSARAGSVSVNLHMCTAKVGCMCMARRWADILAPSYK